jgi:hypothetical protein
MVTPRSLVQEHEPTKGKLREVYLAIREDGQQLAPIEQVLNLAGGYQATVTITSAAAGDYILVIEGIKLLYTATSSDTIASIRNGLAAKANTVKTIRKTGVYAGAKTTGVFRLVRSTTFTATKVGSNMTISAVAAVAGGADQGETEIDLFEPLTGEIQEGQYLTYANANDQERLVQILQKALPGDTTLITARLDQAIDGGSISEYPPYVWDRTSANVERSYANSTVNTFNTGGARDGTPTTSEKSIALPGLYNYANAAYKTALYAAENAAYVHVRVLDPPPNSNFSRGPVVVEGRALVTAAPTAAAQEGQISGDLTIAFMGTSDHADPVPVTA